MDYIFTHSQCVTETHCLNESYKKTGIKALVSPQEEAGMIIVRTLDYLPNEKSAIASYDLEEKIENDDIYLLSLTWCIEKRNGNSKSKLGYKSIEANNARSDLFETMGIESALSHNGSGYTMEKRSAIIQRLDRVITLSNVFEFRGQIVVKDSEKFLNVYYNGHGNKKGFGFGMPFIKYIGATID